MLTIKISNAKILKLGLNTGIKSGEKHDAAKEFAEG
jgi:hypothetical protein